MSGITMTTTTDPDADGDAAVRRGQAARGYLRWRSRHLLDRHGLTDWAVIFLWPRKNDPDRTTFGRCDWAHRLIYLNGAHLMAVGPDYSSPHSPGVDEIVLHEVAHALVGPDVEDQGVEWRQVAEAIGGGMDRDE
jgi:hypothetical protein